MKSEDITSVKHVQKQPLIGGVLYKKCLKNLAILTGKHLCWSLLLMKLQAFKFATLLKRDSNRDVFHSHPEKSFYLLQ